MTLETALFVYHLTSKWPCPILGTLHRAIPTIGAPVYNNYVRAVCRHAMARRTTHMRFHTSALSPLQRAAFPAHRACTMRDPYGQIVICVVSKRRNDWQYSPLKASLSKFFSWFSLWSKNNFQLSLDPWKLAVFVHVLKEISFIVFKLYKFIILIVKLVIEKWILAFAIWKKTSVLNRYSLIRKSSFLLFNI